MEQIRHNQEFKNLVKDFKEAALEEKIEMYVTAEGLTQAQYKELLRLFPMEELYRLEEALA